MKKRKSSIRKDLFDALDGALLGSLSCSSWNYKKSPYKDFEDREGVFHDINELICRSINDRLN